VTVMLDEAKHLSSKCHAGCSVRLVIVGAAMAVRPHYLRQAGQGRPRRVSSSERQSAQRNFARLASGPGWATAPDTHDSWDAQGARMHPMLFRILSILDILSIL
jgi:hypothetical protein